jgi:hypothetical protein
MSIGLLVAFGPMLLALLAISQIEPFFALDSTFDSL